MSSEAQPEISASDIQHWVRLIHGIELPERIAALTAAELGPATQRALAALATYDIEGEPSTFRAVLEGSAEQEP